MWWQDGGENYVEISMLKTCFWKFRVIPFTYILCWKDQLPILKRTHKLKISLLNLYTINLPTSSNKVCTYSMSLYICIKFICILLYINSILIWGNSYIRSSCVNMEMLLTLVFNICFTFIFSLIISYVKQLLSSPLSYFS